MLPKVFGMLQRDVFYVACLSEVTGELRLLVSPLAFAGGAIRRARRWSKVSKGQQGSWGRRRENSQWYRGTMDAGEVLREYEWRQLRPKNDACAPFFAQTGRPNVDSGSVGTSAWMLMMSLSKQIYMGTIRVPFVLTKR